jgi:hypothetical protein
MNTYKIKQANKQRCFLNPNSLFCAVGVKMNYYSAIMASALICSTASAKPAANGRQTSKNGFASKLVDIIKAEDEQSKRLSPDPKTACEKRKEFSSRYRREIKLGEYEIEIEYFDRGGEKGEGNCKLDPADSLLVKVKRKGGSGYALDMEFEDAGVDGKLDKPEDRVEFVGYPGSISEQEQKLVDSIKNGLPSSYQIGFEYRGDQLHAKARVIASKEYEKHIRNSIDFLAKGNKPQKNRRTQHRR